MTIQPTDIISDGFVRIRRQRTDIPFTAENTVFIETNFADLRGIQAAFGTTMKKEKELASVHPLAWNPEFGYITARADCCGTGLELSALFHLEGLHLIGDLDPVLNALNGLRADVRGYDGDGLRNAAHLFRITNYHHLGIDEHAIVARTSRVFNDLVQQETNARIRLVEEVPRVFEDAILRSLAVLRCCRLISEWELLDIISPLRIAAELDFLDHFTREEALALMRERINMPTPSEPNTYEEMREKDRKDATLADKVNKRFKNVRLNARAKDWLS